MQTSEIYNLKQNEKVFRLLVEAVTEYAIFVLSPEGVILTWNAGAQNLKGYSESEIVGKHFSIFYTQADIDRNHPQEELKIARATGKYEEEGWRVRKDGSTFWANVMINRLRDEHGNFLGFSKVTRDLTERRKYEVALKEAEKKLTEANVSLEKKVAERTVALQDALKAKDQFLSIASHELNTPLTSLKLQTQIRKRQLEKKNGEFFNKENITKMLNDDEKQINRLARLVEDMLDISRINTGKFNLKIEQINLSKLVGEVINRFLPQFEYLNTQITYDLKEEVIGEWDTYRIEQVFNNLITNALKYGDAKPVHIEVKKEGNNAVFSVVDQGMGIAAADQTRIFEQYERAISANEVSGFGLGLFISKQIVKAHKGTIQVESEKGKGAKFIVKLPLRYNHQELADV